MPATILTALPHPATLPPWPAPSATHAPPKPTLPRPAALPTCACSVPPLRLKRSAVAAFTIIATVRGFLLNFGVYYATRAALGLPFQWSPSIR